MESNADKFHKPKQYRKFRKLFHGGAQGCGLKTVTKRKRKTKKSPRIRAKLSWRWPDLISTKKQRNKSKGKRHIRHCRFSSLSDAKKRRGLGQKPKSFPRTGGR